MAVVYMDGPFNLLVLDANGVVLPFDFYSSAGRVQ